MNGSDTTVPIELLANGVLEGSRIGLAGIGFALIFYTTKELHFAYGALLTASGYVWYVLTVQANLPLLVGAPIALAAGAAAGAVVQRYLYRRLTSHLAVLLFSFGLAIILENVLHIAFGPADVVLPRNLLTGTVVLFDRIFIRVIDLVTLAVFILVWLVMLYMLERRRIGLAVRAVMRDESMSELVGIRTDRIKLFVYAVGSLVGAIAGLVTIARTGVRPGSGFDVMLFAFIVALLSSGRMAMVPIWSLGLGVFMSLVAWQLPTELRMLLAFAVMLIYLVVRSNDRLRWRQLLPRRTAPAVGTTGEANR